MSFYKLIKITINPTKSSLCTNNNNSNNLTTYFNNTTLTPIKSRDTFRFLGCYFTSYKNHTLSHKIITQEIYQALSLLKKKKITDKQCIYIINIVIIPRFNYRILNTFIPSSTCNIMTNKYTTIVKHKAGIATSMPNSTIHHYRIYNLQHLWDNQIRQYISNTTTLLNDYTYNNNSNNLTTYFNNTTLTLIKPRDTFRFLRCHFTSYKNYTPSYKIIT